MRDILAHLTSWRERGETIGLATVIETWGSSPRQVGAKLAVTLNGGIAGSVSAGCVENDAIQATRAALKSGLPRVLRTAVSDGSVLSEGLTCGGITRILLEPFAAYEAIFEQIQARLAGRDPFGVVSVLEGPAEFLLRKRMVSLDGADPGNLELSESTRQVIRGRLLEPAGFTLDEDGLRLFVDLFPRIPRLVIVGAVHIAEFLVPMASLAGFEIVIVDPRPAFATPERFPGATLRVEWPGEALTALSLDTSTYVAVLSHDTKLDDPALQIALASDARYVGVLGSRRSLSQRLLRLRELGVPEDRFARLRAPIGLHLGGRSAVEIAVSILAELIQARSVSA
jgi:xanthine dehydrogenase accessory factor